MRRRATLLRTGLVILALFVLGHSATARAEAAATGASAGKRVGLVIGNGGYRNVDRLANAGNDARLIAATLRDLGFTLIGGEARIDLDHAGLTQAVQEFGHAIAGADVALFYYSGHGLQVQGVNWLVPVDANPTRVQDLDFQMVDADLVLRQMDGAGTRLNIVLLDACRNNPFATRGLRALQPGLAEMRAPDGTLISYATQPGNVAMDGIGADSPYTTALAATMRRPGLDIFRLFNEVGLAVKRGTGGSQLPWVSTSPIDGDFFFVPTSEPVAPAPAVAPAGPADAPLAPTGSAARQQTIPQQLTLAAPPPQPPGPQPPGPQSPAPQPPPPPSPTDAIAALLRARPCAILDAASSGGAIGITGIAARGADWDSFIRAVGAARGIRVGSPGVEFLPDFACQATDALAPAVRHAREGGRARLLEAPKREIVAGQRIAATIRQAAGKYLTADLFSAGDAVEHIVAAPEPGAERLLSMAAPASGSRVLTVVLSSTPLEIASGAANKGAGAYLAALRDAVLAAPDALADMAAFDIHPARPLAAPVLAAPALASPATPRAPRNPRCAGILERAQLGEPLSDTDRATLRADCR
jgi:hypothetical protein